ncbi:MAG: hypothetical protein Q8K79_22130 [Solirubrobacteraceae bacterium]|nr:hypothetical protein [Solirubrobacteraceae bacterium]
MDRFAAAPPRRAHPRRRPAVAVLIAAAAAGALTACGEDDARPATADRSVPWELRSIDGRQLSLRYRAGACVGEDLSVRPRVTERPARVTIAVIARRPAVARCTGRVRIGDLRVTLRAPLGDRSLVHGPLTTGRPSGGSGRLTPWCPADAPAGRRLDARRLIGLTTRAARDLAAEFDCRVRVIERDGRALPHTQDLRRDRINVDVRDDYVLRASVG